VFVQHYAHPHSSVPSIGWNDRSGHSVLEPRSCRYRNAERRHKYQQLHLRVARGRLWSLDQHLLELGNTQPERNVSSERWHSHDRFTGIAVHDK